MEVECVSREEVAWSNPLPRRLVAGLFEGCGGHNQVGRVTITHGLRPTC